MMLAVALVLSISAILLVNSVIEMYERVRVARLVHRHASPHPTRRAPNKLHCEGSGGDSKRQCAATQGAIAPRVSYGLEVHFT